MIELRFVRNGDAFSLNGVHYRKIYDKFCKTVDTMTDVVIDPNTKVSYNDAFDPKKYIVFEDQEHKIIVSTFYSPRECDLYIMQFPGKKFWVLNPHDQTKTPFLRTFS